MTSAEVRDLSDAEVRARLEQRECPIEVVEALLAERDTPAGDERLAAALA